MTLIRSILALCLLALALPAQAQSPVAKKKPNILIIWGDDIGGFNISAYNQGMMGYRTPNIDSIAKGGALFTDWYGQQSCTAGRAAFVTGQSPIRTGLTKVGLPERLRACARKTRRLRRCCAPRATARVSSARTTSATATTCCRPSTASTSSSATCTT
jgi:hypothetical protein